jgi:exodeoxyribonuclease VII large subunit
MLDARHIGPTDHVWQVGALCHAIADAIDVRFNPVTVDGEISGFAQASSGHCYFTLKDGSGQLRCAMFRRVASLLKFGPRDGDRVEIRGRLGVYEARGELQLIVESLRVSGQGTLFEQFLLRKAKLEKEGLFDSSRKRPLPASPRGVGVVTSLGAAALHDVVTTLQRRVPHIPVVLAPASVQGEGAPQELSEALCALYQLTGESAGAKTAAVDVILLVRGGGSIEDLWAFNDETLARMIARSPVPIICGVGHETDFTIADFVADLRAPTPTAAAELVSIPNSACLEKVDELGYRMRRNLVNCDDRESQRLDLASSRLGRPSALAQRQRLVLGSAAQRLRHGVNLALLGKQSDVIRSDGKVLPALEHAIERQRNRIQRAALRLGLLDPALVLRRGYAWLTFEDGRTLTSTAQAVPGAKVRASLTDGTVDLTITNGNAI